MNVVVFGGGTAANYLVPCFNELGGRVAYVLPISDNGGSTSEILRVIGGPAIGDIRSRIVRVIDDQHVVQVLSYRLPDDSKAAKAEWTDVVEGGHKLWAGVPAPLRECIRPFLAHIQSELLKRSKISKPFQFAKASIGNLFLTGARLFLGSLDAAIELMLRIGRSDKSITVIPCINSNHMYHISALLENGMVITGQSQISHPSVSSSRYPTQLNNCGEKSPRWNNISPLSTSYILEEEEEDATPFYIHPDLKTSQLYFEKMLDEQPLSAPVQRVFYINPYGEEIFPSANSRVIQHLKKCDMLVYSVGSLITSLMPMVILGNVAEVIVETKMKKVLLINSTYDRETFGISGLRYVNMMIEAMEVAATRYKKSMGKMDHMRWPATAYITDIVCTKGGQIQIEQKVLERKGIRFHNVEGEVFENTELSQILSKI
ncbi:HCL116Wp [Eremothecium sinecaudum]|uniref:HCL116Wp n=1 Tax=Eremothecium sinecaudum TaxID=45286 RepID=A0A0X8HRD7_9SACH|nr:HCL116Wp [Eremothecium sinecaudum]AMD20035.1 HCL116Wp [Eremothecium sinecaudum]